MTFDTAFERSHKPNDVVEAPERIGLHPEALLKSHGYIYTGDAIEAIDVVYVREDLLATKVAEARRQAFKEAVEIAQRHSEHSGYTLHQRGSEALDCRNVIWRELEDAAALERAAATDNKEK